MSNSVFLLSEFTTAVLAAIFDMALVGIFIFAYRRCRQSFFVVLCGTSLAFAFANAYCAILIFSAIVPSPVVARAIMPLLTPVYIIIYPVTEVISFIATLLLIRFTLRLHRREET